MRANTEIHIEEIKIQLTFDSLLAHYDPSTKLIPGCDAYPMDASPINASTYRHTMFHPTNILMISMLNQP